MSRLATPVAQVASRLLVVGPQRRGEGFLIAAQLAEVGIKAVGSVILGGLRFADPEFADELGQRLVRDPTLGTWVDSLLAASKSHRLAAELPGLTAWLTTKTHRSQGRAKATIACEQILRALGHEPGALGGALSNWHLFRRFVEIRNALMHGAPGLEFFADHFEPYRDAVLELISISSPLQWRWVYCDTDAEVVLVGESPVAVDPMHRDLGQIGIHVDSPDGTRIFCGDLIRTSRQCARFNFLNGRCSAGGKAQFLDYANGTLKQLPIRWCSQASAPGEREAPTGSAVKPDETARTTEEAGGHSPAYLTSFVGREADLTKIRSLLNDPQVRLVTITGLGGIGKTRLVSALLETIGGDFLGGTAYVGLEQLSSFTEFTEALTEAADRIRVRGQPALLILDNFEHLPRGCETALFDQLGRSPTIKVLVTSRAALSIEGQWEYPLSALPTPKVEVALEDVSTYAAVRLFLERVKAAAPDVELGPDSWPIVAAICRGLDGLPFFGSRGRSNTLRFRSVGNERTSAKT